MRKNLLGSVLASTEGVTGESLASRADYTRRGASRTMLDSLDELADAQRKLVEGETIVSIDPQLIDASFLSDRMDDDEAEFALLKASIQAQGQLSPALVRPRGGGRYMTVFGHRRVRAARELGIEVKAVVRSLEDIGHILAQGQENSARRDLSYIEKASLARKLAQMGQSRDVITAALSIDEPALSRMLAVTSEIPEFVLKAFGSARGIGRDRWEVLRKLLPGKTEIAERVVQSAEFVEASNKFEVLERALKSGRPRKVSAKESYLEWRSDRVTASFEKTGNRFTIKLGAEDGSQFGAFVQAQMDRLYAEFKSQQEQADAVA